MFPELASIKARREKLGVKQKQLAEIANVSQSLIAKLEKSKLEPSYSVARKIFNAIDNLEHKKEKKCSELMTKKVIFSKGKDKVSRASELMKKHAVDQLPVLQGRQVIGSISESLIFSKLLNSEKKKLFSMQIKDIMTEPFPIVNSSMPVSLVLPMLKTIDAILVAENSRLVGIITKANLI